ncbi:WD40 repeat domain-containing serine/threonine protein kinase [Microbispora sp. ATCC PTA-5024]|uniref:WD40 repeat domain-containing serine/threonine protein kinase n=1 Tax=Microbispora sp. ATCC PTA-5024 TaxID=316330 RepID=UPI0003DB862E|nr:WD40 repeat domain-containing serine/threonine-protein kinase [Microbispora sp. ATCC PTA-5024]ETK37768.1 hypothetical protein MPTA5024_02210 [Microbispora sp. ATCC PTA-5024]
MPALAPGDPRQLGEYWLAGRLGEGGQGVVYEGYDASGRRVAIKVLHPSAGAELRGRFAKEAAATRAVAAFCTARVLSVELDGVRPYIVSEYVGGPSLRRAVESGGPYGPDDLRRLATGIATALTAIHEAGVIHRDLKPDNILIGPDGPRVIDFGIARTSEMSLTPTGQVAGTPAFMAPETVVGRRAGPAVDVWAWGAVVLYAAIGRDPFEGENLAALLHRILATDIDVSFLQEPLRDLVAAALAKDPDDRPTSRSLLLSLVGGRGLSADALLAEGSRAAERIRPPAQLSPPPLESVAEQVYRRLRGTDQALVPQIMLRMVMPGDGAEDMLREVPSDELDDGVVQPPVLERVLTGFVRAELVVRNGETVSLANAALLRAWPRMREWIDADRDGLRVHRRLGAAAQHWDAHGRRTADLYQGSALETALSWAATGRQHVTLNLVENAFLDAGLAHSRIRDRRRRQITAALSGLLVIALAAGGVAVTQRAEAVRERDIGLARALAAEAETARADDPLRAMTLSVRAWRLAPVLEARAALYGSVSQLEDDVFRPSNVTGAAVFALSHDGRRLAIADSGRASVWDVRTRRRVAEVDIPGGAVTAAAFNPDGRVLAVAGPTVTTWDLTTSRPAGPAFGRGGSELTFSPGGRYMAIVDVKAGRWQVWEPGSGRLVVDRPGPDVKAVAMSDRFAAPMVTGRRFEFWDLATGARVDAPDGGRGAAVAFGPGGAVAVCAGDQVRIHRPEGADVVLEGAAAARMEFSPDGALLLTFDWSAIGVWSAVTGRSLLSYGLDDSGGGLTAAVGPGDRTLSYLRGDGSVVTVSLGDLTGAPGTAHGIASGQLSGDGRLAAYSDGTRVWLRDTRRGAAVALGEGLALAFSPDGRTLATGALASPDVTVWDLVTWPPTVLTRLRRPPGTWPRGLAFSPSGRYLAVAPARDDTWGPVEVWRTAVATGGSSAVPWSRVPGPGPSPGPPGADAMAFDPADTALAVGSEHNALVSLTGGRSAAGSFGASGTGVRSVAFSRSGAIIATGFSDVGVALWDATTHARIGQLAMPGDEATALAFSPDDRYLAVGGQSGEVSLWDVASRRPLGTPYRMQAGVVLSLAFTPDGRRLLSLAEDEVLRTYPIDPRAALNVVCARLALYGRDCPTS